MTKKQINSSISQKQQSISNIKLRIHPYDIKVIQQGHYKIYLEKGKQILGTIKTILKKQDIPLQTTQSINFQIFNERNMSCTWSIYKINDENQVFYDQIVFNIKQSWQQFKKNSKNIVQQTIQLPKSKIFIKFLILFAKVQQQFPKSQIIQKIKDIEFVQGRSQSISHQRVSSTQGVKNQLSKIRKIQSITQIQQNKDLEQNKFDNLQIQSNLNDKEQFENDKKQRILKKCSESNNFQYLRKPQQKQMFITVTKQRDYINKLQDVSSIVIDTSFKSGQSNRDIQNQSNHQQYKIIIKDQQCKQPEINIYRIDSSDSSKRITQRIIISEEDQQFKYLPLPIQFKPQLSQILPITNQYDTSNLQLSSSKRIQDNPILNMEFPENQNLENRGEQNLEKEEVQELKPFKIPQPLSEAIINEDNVSLSNKVKLIIGSPTFSIFSSKIFQKILDKLPKTHKSTIKFKRTPKNSKKAQIFPKPYDMGVGHKNKKQKYKNKQSGNIIMMFKFIVWVITIFMFITLVTSLMKTKSIKKKFKK